MRHNMLATLIVLVIIALHGTAQAEDNSVAGELVLDGTLIIVPEEADLEATASSSDDSHHVVATSVASSRAAARGIVERRATEMANLLCHGTVNLDDADIVYHQVGSGWMASVRAPYICSDESGTTL